MNLRSRLQQLKKKIVDMIDDYPSLQAVPYWLAAFVVGFVAVAYTTLFHQTGELARYIVDKYQYWALLILPVFMVLGFWVVKRFAPLAVGSGIPQVMTALELDATNYEKRLDLLLGVRTVLVKVTSSLLVGLGGAAVGPEGPAIQICAGLFHSIGKRFQRIWPQIGHESLILAGGAAGVAAAFNTPLGGIVFAIEELSHSHFHKVKTALISAVIISGLVAQWIKGPYLLFGYPVLNVASYSFFLWAILIGVVTGLLGAASSKAAIWGARRFSSMIRRDQVLYNLWIGCSIVIFACLFGNQVLGSGISLASDLLFKGKSSVDEATLLGRIIFPVLSYVAGGASGLLAPAITAGAVIGRYMNDLFSVNYPNLMVLLGMIGFLSAFTRAPFTAFVLVVEMTDRHSAIFFMMATSLIASAVSRSWGGKSLYENRKEAYLAQVNQALLQTAPDSGQSPSADEVSKDSKEPPA